MVQNHHTSTEFRGTTRRRVAQLLHQGTRRCNNNNNNNNNNNKNTNIEHHQHHNHSSAHSSSSSSSATCNRQFPLFRHSIKVFILISCALLVNLSTLTTIFSNDHHHRNQLKHGGAGRHRESILLAEAGSKSKEKSSKTTVIAISGGNGPGKAHPVPVPWPVVHCHHHHHHLKYVPKPVLVHHWVKKIKPQFEIEASNEHYQVMNGLDGGATGNARQADKFVGGASAPASNHYHQLASSPASFPMLDSNMLLGGISADPSQRQLAPMVPSPLSLFSQSDRNKLPYDLMDGSQLVSALSNAFDPLLSSPPAFKPSFSPQVGDQFQPHQASATSSELAPPKMSLLFPSDPQHPLNDAGSSSPSSPSSSSMYNFSDSSHNNAKPLLQFDDSHDGNRIEKEFKSYQQQQHLRNNRQKKPSHTALSQSRSGTGKPASTGGPQFSSKQLAKLTKTIRAVQKQQQQQQGGQRAGDKAMFPPHPIDTDSVDSFKNHVVALDSGAGVQSSQTTYLMESDADLQQQQQQQNEHQTPQPVGEPPLASSYSSNKPHADYHVVAGSGGTHTEPQTVPTNSSSSSKPSHPFNDVQDQLKDETANIENSGHEPY